MREHLDSLTNAAFVKPTQEELHTQEERLSHIREVSADYILALTKESSRQQTEVTEKPRVTLPGKVEKIIEPAGPGEPDKAQISVESADPLYRELRIENTLEDEAGNKVQLKENADVDVTVEADKKVTVPKQKQKEKD
jgi:hypothetical protein